MSPLIILNNTTQYIYKPKKRDCTLSWFHLLHFYIFSEAMRKAMLAKIRSEGMSEDDVAKMMAVFDKQGSKNVSGGVWW